MLRFLGIRGVISEIERNSEELSVQWNIHNFFSLSGKGGDYYRSPDFNFSNARWCLQINSNGDTRNRPSGFVDLFLERKDSGPPMTIKFTLCITGEEGLEKTQKFEYRFELPYEFGYGIIEFLPRNVLKDYQSILMPNGVLTVTCTMKNVVSSAYTRGVSSNQDTARQTFSEFKESSACTGGSQSLHKQDASIQTDEESREAKASTHSSRKQDASVQTDEKSKEAKASSHSPGKQDASVQTNEESKEANASSHSPGKQGIEKAMENIGKLLASGEDSDVTVQVGDVEFKVHRAILSARCPVLSAMFRHDTQEKASNRISISDCEPEVFQQYLHFIYSGSAKLLTEQNAFGLYRVADKYLADDLKQQCLEHIRDTLSVRTFCETVKLALTHDESDLLQLAIDFAVKNLPLIVCTVEWQNFIIEYPREANEIFIKCICPRG